MGKRLAASAWVLLVLAACDASDVGACPDRASRLHVLDGDAYCVYPAGAGPERNVCPSEVPRLVVQRGVTLCTSAAAPSMARFDELCALPDVACDVAPTGWTLMLGTRMSSVCPDVPDVHGVVGCAAVVSAWGGGIADTVRDHLLVWGGGGSNYFGNEVYALDVSARTVERLTEPSPPSADPRECVATLADGRPNARQTGDNLAFVAHADRMFARGGFLACEGGAGATDTWTLDLRTREWQPMDPTVGQPPPGNIAATDYDARSRLVYLHDTRGLWSYDLDSNTYASLVEEDETDYHMVGRIEPVERLFVMIGGGQAWSFDLAPGRGYARRALALPGCDPVVTAPYPGLAYDPVEAKLVAWAGGDTVYLIDAGADTCEPRAVAGDPGPQQPNGTSGRFRYFASVDGFVLINEMDEDAYLLRLRASP